MGNEDGDDTPSRSAQQITQQSANEVLPPPDMEMAQQPATENPEEDNMQQQSTTVAPEQSNTQNTSAPDVQVFKAKSSIDNVERSENDISPTLSEGSIKSTKPSRKLSPYPLPGTPLEKNPSGFSAAESMKDHPTIPEDRPVAHVMSGRINKIGDSGQDREDSHLQGAAQKSKGKLGPYPGKRTNPRPFFENNDRIQPGVFTTEFQEQYVADYSMPEDVPSKVCVGFLPPIMTPIQYTHFDSVLCKKDKNEVSCVYYLRLVISITAHLVFFASVVAAIVFAVLSMVVPLSIYLVIATSYIVMLAESFYSHDLKYLTRGRNMIQFQDYLNQAHLEKPILTLRVECYHYETMGRKTMDSDEALKLQDNMLRVVTHRETEPFEFSEYVDFAPPTVEAIAGKTATKILFYRTFQFGDEETSQRFEKQSQSIRDRNRNKDFHMSYYEEFTIPIRNYEDGELVFFQPTKQRTCMNVYCYFLASVLCCTWPYRLMFKKKTARTTYTFIKQIKGDPPPGRSSKQSVGKKPESKPSVNQRPEEKVENVNEIVAPDLETYDPEKPKLDVEDAEPAPDCQAEDAGEAGGGQSQQDPEAQPLLDAEGENTQ